MATKEIYLPLVRQSVDLTVVELINITGIWETTFRETVVLLLRSMADAMERYPEHLPPKPNFRIVFELEEENWSARLVAKVEIDD